VDAETFWADRVDELEEYARLAPRVGVNLEQGQDVTVLADVVHAPLVRATARVPTARARGWSRPTISTSTSAESGRRTRPTRRSVGRDVSGGGGFGIIDASDEAELNQLILEMPFSWFSDVEVRPFVQAAEGLQQFKQAVDAMAAVPA
jgi:muconolactone delta-isomerase